ncbi:M28 family peptidase [Rapidithrix thailandica]|uniref:M28 family peptidase n=1 Tax=Rapidithrix thailandica TaxID=413964 RepID=A0AAW9S0H3_9BACT
MQKVQNFIHLVLIGVFIFLFNLPLSSQNMNRVREVTDSLCSPYMFGRGYLKNGDKRAAQYIRNHYQYAGLLAFSLKGYFQEFMMSINTFPEESVLKINNKTMKLGSEYILDGMSGAGKLKGDVFYFEDLHWVTKEDFASRDLSETILVYDQKLDQEIFKLTKEQQSKIYSAQAIILLADKLTQTLAQFQLPLPRIILKKALFPKDIKKVKIDVMAELIYGYPSQNVIGYIRGTAQPDSFVVFTAHYDHLGGIGEEVYFPGANDNASGVAMLIELANYFSKNPPEYSVAFMAFGGEEAGLIGSKFYTENTFFPLKKIKFLLNLDLFGTGEKGATVVNGSVFKEAFALLTEINKENNYITEIKSRGKAANSDHYFFSEKGVPAFFIYLMGDWEHYHDIQDQKPLPYTEFRDAFRLLVDFAERL